MIAKGGGPLGICRTVGHVLAQGSESNTSWRRSGVALTVALLISACGGEAPPQTHFTNVTAASGIAYDSGFRAPLSRVTLDRTYTAGGAAAGDYDGDGDIDVFIVRGDIGPNLLYRNLGDMAFEEVAAAAGLANTKSASENYRHAGPMFADMDGDGDLDLFIGGLEGDPALIFRNEGDGVFSDVTAGSGIDAIRSEQSVGAAFGDYDLDGDLDLFISHWGTERDYSAPGDTEHLWRNDSDASGIRFTGVTVEAGISPTIMTLPDPLIPLRFWDHTFTPSFTRIDDDLYPDILSVADFNNTQYFVNNQDGSFSNATDTAVLTDDNGMGSALGDYDHDGDLDWFVSSIQIAAVGRTEEQLQADGVGYRAGRYEFQHTARGMALQENGIVKILVAEDGRILGGHVGPHASILIQEIVIAMQAGGAIELIIEAVHAHPALPQVVEEAAKAAQRALLDG